jgi:peptidoglycan/LPS O-acetylase OafA/YrhL
MGIIRLLLALSVVATHAGPILGSRLVGGQIAVQSFYIISGFYMSLILNEKYIAENNSFKLFITNRFIRLFPVYWVVLIGTVAVCLGVAIYTNGQIMPKFDSYLSVKANLMTFFYLVATNILLFGQDLVMFLGIIPENGSLYFTSNFAETNLPLHSFLFVPQAWTLSLELTFYLIAPFILRKGYKVVLMLIVSSLILRLFIYNIIGYQNDPWTYRFFPTEIMFFLLGYVSYQIKLKLHLLKISKSVILSVLVFVVLFTFLYQYLPTARLTYSPFSWIEILYFFSIVLSIPFLFNYFKNIQLDNQIGDLSYPVYISHMLVIMVFTKLPFTFLKAGWVISVITLAVSFSLNRIIARPLEKFRQSRLIKSSK